MRVRKVLERRDAGGVEPVGLRAADPGDEREVLVPLPLLLAEREELAERTVVDRVRVGRPPALDRVEKPPLEPPVVSEEVAGPTDPGRWSSPDRSPAAHHRWASACAMA